MADLRSKLTLEGSDFSKTIEDAGKQVNEFQKKTEGASKSINDMGKQTSHSASELLKQMKTMEGLGRSTSNYRNQLGQMSRQIQDLTINYQQMSEEMKNSDFGREVAAKIDELKSKAAEYKDAIGDAQNAVRALSSDTANLDAAKMGIEGISAAFSLVTSAGILSADTTEKLVKVMAKLKAIEAATNAVIKIANVLNKDSILMIKLKQLAVKNDTAETIKSTAAEKLNTQAVRENTTAKIENAGATQTKSAAESSSLVTGGKLGTVVKNLTSALKVSRIAKLGVAAAVVALVAKYVKWSNATREEIAMQQKLGYYTDEQRKKMQEQANAISSSIAKAASSFDKLANGYSMMSSWADKTKFLKEYSNELDKLGLHAKNVNDLEQMFINKTDEYKKTVLLRAQYLALQAEAQKAYEEAFTKVSTKVASNASTKKENDIIVKPQVYFEMYDLKEGIDYTKISEEYTNITAKLTKEGVAKLKQAGIELGADLGEVAAEAAAQPFEDIAKVVEEKAKQLGISLKDTVITPDKFDTGSLEYWNKQVQELQSALDKIDPHSERYDSTLKKLNEAKLKVEEIKEQMSKNELSRWTKSVEDLQKQLNSIDPHSEKYNAISEKLDDAKKKMQEAQQAVDLIDLAKWQKSAAELQSQLDSIDPHSEKYNTISENLDEANTKVAELHKSLIEMKVVPKGLDEWQSRVTYLQGMVNKIDPNSEAFKLLAENLAEAQQYVTAMQRDISKADISAWNKQIENLQKQLDSIDPNSEAYQPILDKLNEAKAKVAELNAALAKVSVDPNSLEAWSKKVQDLQTQLNLMDPHSEKYKAIADEFVNASRKLAEMQKQIDKMKQKPIQLLPPKDVTLKEASDEVSRLRSLLQDTKPSTEEYASILAALKNWQAEMDILQKQYDAVTSKSTELQNVGNVTSNLSSINSSIGSIYSSIESLGNAWDDSTSAVEGFFNSIGAVLSVLQNIVSIMETINSLKTIMNSLESTGIILSKAKNAESIKEAGIETGLTGVKSTNATIDTVDAAATAAKSASSIPVVGWVLALAAVAAIIAAIASAKSSVQFANGGIVPGSSFSGDKITAQLNSGEMVLNTAQQKRLFDLLDGGSTTGEHAKVEFVIKGQELKGVLDNYNKKMSRV